MIEFTDRAVELLERATEAARRFDPEARVRVAGEPGQVRFELADGSEPNDRTVPCGGVSVDVAANLSGLVDVEEPHDRLILRPGPVDP